MAWPDRGESQLSNGDYEDLVGQIIVGAEGVFAPTIISSIAQVVYELSEREMRGSRGRDLTKISSLDLEGLSDSVSII